MCFLILVHIKQVYKKDVAYELAQIITKSNVLCQPPKCELR